MNRYLYADGDPVNNIDPDGHLPEWLQRGWKATKKWAKKGYDFAIGDDIRTLKSPKSKWYHKAGAAASLASNFIPGAGAVKWGVKAVKYGKKMKKSRKFAAASIKKMRKAKLKAKASRARIKPKLRRPVSGDNVGVNLRAKGTGNGYKYWNKTTVYKNVKVYQRDDIIDPYMKDARGRTNLERMEKGLAPLGPDGKPINLHHMTQRNESSIAEVTQTFHKENSKIIHINPNTIPSGINRNEFDKWRKDYWKHRVSDFK